MSFNFAELQQKADRVLFNADQFIRRYIDFALAPAQDVTIQYYDQNGNLQTFTVPNRQKLVNQLYTDLPNSMVRTFYVDQVNGNDNYSGTQQQPFRTLQKAISSVPAGGVGIIHLLSDFNLNDSIHILEKNIIIHLNGKTLTTSYYVGSDGLAYKSIMAVYRASLGFVFPGKIVIPPSPQGAQLAAITYAFITSGNYSPTSIASIGFFIDRHFQNEYTFLEVHSGSLVGYMGSDGSASAFTHVGFFARHNVTAIVANGAYLISTFGRPFSIGLSFENNADRGFLKRPDGTVITNFANVIAGIVRDASGVPRNIISNRVL